MKRLFLAISALALTAACSQDELVEEAQPASYDLTVTATMPEADTRTHVEDKAVCWDDGDKITIVSSDFQYSATLDLVGDAGSYAMFSGTVTFNPSLLVGGTAYYTPESSNIDFTYSETSSLTYGLKSSATYEYYYSADSQLMSSYSPMTGSYDDGKVSFQHTAALMRIVLKGVPENTSGTLKLTGGTSSTSIGTSLSFGLTSYEWNVSFRNGYSDGKADDMTFDIPIPAAKALTYTATISEGDDTKTIGSKETTTTSPTAGQMIVMEAKDYGTLFPYDLNVNATTTDYSNPTSEES